MKTLSLVALAGVLAGCASAPLSNTPADETMTALETRLLEADAIRIEFAIKAEGALDAAVTGTCTWQNGEMELVTAGTFMGQPCDLRLVSKGEMLEAATPAMEKVMPRGKELKTAVMLGLTRMGLLHNIAYLSGGKGPDHREGGARQWIEAIDGRWVDANTMEFGLKVSGKDTATFTIELNDDRLPTMRRQSVQFPTPSGPQEMRVTEAYTVFRVQ